MDHLIKGERLVEGHSIKKWLLCPFYGRASAGEFDLREASSFRASVFAASTGAWAVIKTREGVF